MSRQNPSKAINKEIPHLTRDLEFCFSHSLEQVIRRPTRITNQTPTLVDHIPTNWPDKVSKSGLRDLGLSDHNLIYWTRKTSLPKSWKHNEIFVHSMKKYSVKKFLKNLRFFQDVFANYLTNTCQNGAICRGNKFHNPSKNDQSEGQLKTFFWQPIHVSNTKMG